ncbi:MAG: class I SAM-dependent methyltransferase [Candidatus Alcyoniella australis]|nr:class I SAM-dependent methyltransferase [Candidatus Alcyoniella australis]
MSDDLTPRLDTALSRIIEYGRRLEVDELTRHRRSIHIGSALGAAQYVQIARELAAQLPPGASVLDWGSGWGHNSFLLDAAGLKVTSFDVRPTYYQAWPWLFGDQSTRPLIGGADDSALPFADGSFDAVLSCGVLEHVPDDMASLDEIQRILRPGGLLAIYHLPNRLSWTEALGRLLGRIAHERLYSRRGVGRLLREHGFKVELVESYHWLPRNLPTRLGLGREPGVIVRAYLGLDRLLTSLWPLKLLSTALRVNARKETRS